ncbi:hypothetical protein DVH24_018051 [Malus domestica]|uniref:RNase H type-1 domain-containing protein n=1 Tax=Malus domestica TaxID=3750 RepID=A0A498KCW7_MALDO|nr:hypothetical protein DVH24_018051 [Malus domestica]
MGCSASLCLETRAEPTALCINPEPKTALDKPKQPFRKKEKGSLSLRPLTLSQFSSQLYLVLSLPFSHSISPIAPTPRHTQICPPRCQRSISTTLLNFPSLSSVSGKHADVQRNADDPKDTQIRRDRECRATFRTPLTVSRQTEVIKTFISSSISFSYLDRSLGSCFTVGRSFYSSGVLLREACFDIISQDHSTNLSNIGQIVEDIKRQDIILLTYPITHTRRQANGIAHRLARFGLSLSQVCDWYDSPPSLIVVLVKEISIQSFRNLYGKS